MSRQPRRVSAPEDGSARQFLLQAWLLSAVAYATKMNKTPSMARPSAPRLPLRRVLKYASHRDIRYAKAHETKQEKWRQRNREGCTHMSQPTEGRRRGNNVESTRGASVRSAGRVMPDPAPRVLSRSPIRMSSSTQTPASATSPPLHARKRLRRK